MLYDGFVVPGVLYDESVVEDTMYCMYSVLRSTVVEDTMYHKYSNLRSNLFEGTDLIFYRFLSTSRLSFTVKE